MLSYQHIYHAGCFADTQKHALLIKTLASLKAKHAALTVLDTHAGRGVYDLSSDEALKTGEFRNGISLLRDGEEGAVGDYLEAVRVLNDGGELRRYPGSAYLAAKMLRPSDKMVACELHPGEFAELQRSMAPFRNVTPVRKDGLAAMDAEMPPQNRRGICVIDPSYEIRTDYAAVAKQIIRTWKKWPQGVFFLWYPILAEEPHRAMLTDIRKSDIGSALASEIRMKAAPEGGFAMTGTGVLIVNPPLPEGTARSVTEHIAGRLNAAGEVYWLGNRKIDPETGMVA